MKYNECLLNIYGLTWHVCPHTGSYATFLCCQFSFCIDILILHFLDIFNFWWPKYIQLTINKFQIVGNKTWIIFADIVWSLNIINWPHLWHFKLLLCKNYEILPFLIVFDKDRQQLRKCEWYHWIQRYQITYFPTAHVQTKPQKSFTRKSLRMWHSY